MSDLIGCLVLVTVGTEREEEREEVEIDLARDVCLICNRVIN